MTILVFGKTGQVARELPALAPVIALGRDEADLSAPGACAAAIERHAPKAVVNAAAYTAVDRAEDEEGVATQINGVAPTEMAKVCAAHDIPFVHISTDYVFDGGGDALWRPYDRVAPISAYGRSKLAGERGVASAGGRFAILRTSWVFSAHANNFVKTMLHLSETRSELDIVADQIGGPTPAKAVASACITIADQLADDPSKAGTYHLSGASDVSWAEFARAIFAAANKDITVHGIPSSEYPTRATRPLNSRLECSATQAVFGIGRPDWHTGLKAVLQELRNRKVD